MVQKRNRKFVDGLQQKAEVSRLLKSLALPGPVRLPCKAGIAAIGRGIDANFANRHRSCAALPNPNQAVAITVMGAVDKRFLILC